MKMNIILCALVATTLIFTSCDNGTTATEQAKSDSTKMNKTDTADNKMSMGDMKKMDNGLMASMNNMIGKMSDMKMTGDFDIDFASMMIAHHQGAIDMSEAEIKSGKDEKIKAMAQNIITKQKEEQSKLRDIVKTKKLMKMNMGQGDALNKDMNEMKANMSTMKMSGNTDKDFVMMMLSHHESAIKMAKTELSNGMNAELKQIAKNIIGDQTKGIGEFKNWLSANK